MHDAAILGEENVGELDCSCFYSTREFKQSAHFAWEKIAVRTEEAPSRSFKVDSDLFKRFVTHGKIDLRENYGRTAKRRFGDSYKVWECNPETIPFIEDCSDHLDDADHLKRRIIAFVVGQAKFTTNDAEVDHSSGIFKAISQERLVAFLQHPVVFSLTWKVFYIRR